jgi:hypothetical protein
MAVTNLFDIVHELGKINSVVGCRDLEPENEFQLTSFNEIEIECEHGLFTVVADDELDTVSVDFAESCLQFKRDISDSDPWNRVIGSPILWAWLLTNQQGYTDGFQFEVRTTDDFVDVQLMCEATAFDVRLVISL